MPCCPEAKDADGIVGGLGAGDGPVMISPPVDPLPLPTVTQVVGHGQAIPARLCTPAGIGWSLHALPPSCDEMMTADVEELSPTAEQSASVGHETASSARVCGGAAAALQCAPPSPLTMISPPPPAPPPLVPTATHACT
jgi:hypothetical protein